jgi:hypothetical protein
MPTVYFRALELMPVLQSVGTNGVKGGKTRIIHIYIHICVYNIYTYIFINKHIYTHVYKNIYTCIQHL